MDCFLAFPLLGPLFPYGHSPRAELADFNDAGVFVTLKFLESMTQRCPHFAFITAGSNRRSMRPVRRKGAPRLGMLPSASNASASVR